MATTNYYVSASGSDANSGLSVSLPKLTLAAGSALFHADSSDETLNVEGAFYADTTTHAPQIIQLSGCSNKTIKQREFVSGGSAPLAAFFRGDNLIATTGWTSIGNGVYTKAIPASLTLTALQYGWDTHTLSATGQHAWGMVAVATAAAVTTYATGTGGAKGVYYYEPTVTGLITAYFGGDNPNSSGHQAGYICTENTSAFVRFIGGSNNVVSGIAMALLPKYTGQFGWGVRAEGCTGVTVIGCIQDDLGAHYNGTLGSSGDGSGFTISGCTMRGFGPVATGGIFHQFTADKAGGITGCVVSNCTIRQDRWLGIDGNLAHGQLTAVGAFAANTCVGVYGHGDSGNACIAANGITIVNTAFSTTEAATSGAGMKPFAVDNAVAVTPGAGEDVPGNFPILSDYCTFTNYPTVNVAASTGAAYVRRFIDISTFAAPAGFANSGCWLNILAVDSANYTWTFETGFVSRNLNAGSETRMCAGQASTGGTKHINFRHVSFYDSSAVGGDFSGFLDAANENVKYFTARGCIFAHAVTGTAKCLYIRDTATALAGNPITDCLYLNIDSANGRYAQNAAYTAAQWVANVDTAATVAVNVLSATPYADITNGGLVSSAQLLRRVLTTFQRTATALNGVSGSTNFGANEYLLPGNVTGRNAGRQPGTDRLSRMAR